MVYKTINEFIGLRFDVPKQPEKDCDKIEISGKLMRLAQYFDPKIRDFNYMIALFIAKDKTNRDIKLSDEDFKIYQSLYAFPVSGNIKITDTRINSILAELFGKIKKRKIRLRDRLIMLSGLKTTRVNNAWYLTEQQNGEHNNKKSLRYKIQEITEEIFAIKDIDILKKPGFIQDEFTLNCLIENLELIKSGFRDKKDIQPILFYDIKNCLRNTPAQLKALINEIRKDLNKAPSIELKNLVSELCTLEEMLEYVSLKVDSGILIDDLVLNLFDNIPTDETALPFEKLVEIAMDFYNSNQNN